jgi:hypothetical protein
VNELKNKFSEVIVAALALAALVIFAAATIDGVSFVKWISENLLYAIIYSGFGLVYSVAIFKDRFRFEA